MDSYAPSRHQATQLPQTDYHRNSVPLCTACHVTSAPTKQFESSGRHQEASEAVDQGCNTCHSMAALFGTELQHLKEEHQKTLTVLEKLYHNQKALKEVTLSLLGSPAYLQQEEVVVMEEEEEREEREEDENEEEEVLCETPLVITPAHSPSLPNMNPDYSCCEEQLSVSACDQDLLSCDTSESEDEEKNEVDSSEAHAFASPGLTVIEHMWDDFSVEEYTSIGVDGVRPAADAVRSRSPHITIPRPFSMLAREESKPKKKSRSLQIAEQEQLERAAEEEALLKWQFRANPVPASTFLPLYELIRAQNEQQQKRLKATSCQVLKSSERPFSFIAREKEKRKEREMQQRVQEEQEEVRSKRERTFKARPVPSHVFDPRVDERLQEQEDYRGVCIMVRAHEMLAHSKLPGNMRFRGRNYTIGSLRRKRHQRLEKQAFLTSEHQFHPTVNPIIPDHHRAYTAFQEKLMERKQSNETTVTRPFTLQTELRASLKREAVEQDLLKTSTSHKASKSKKPCSTSGKDASKYTSPFIPMTRSSKLRQQATTGKLSTIAEEEAAQEALQKEQQEREREIQRIVLLRSIPNDLTAWLEKRQRQNKQLLRCT